MSISLALQHTYDGIEIALVREAHCLIKVREDKKLASKKIIVLIDELLRSQQLSLPDITFIGVNQGPGPFTTLRTVIASVNGLSFATKKPLIGIDGLDALVDEHRQKNHPVTIALLNAFTQDAYFAIDNQLSNTREKGYKNNVVLALELKERFPHEQLYFVGNGAQLYESEIRRILGTQAVFAQPLPEHCSIQQIGHMSYARWKQQESIVNHLLPLYLKTQIFGK